MATERTPDLDGYAEELLGGGSGTVGTGMVQVSRVLPLESELMAVANVTDGGRQNFACPVGWRRQTEGGTVASLKST